MIINSGCACIIADDLTGANDSSLQFHIHGVSTQILLSENFDLQEAKTAQVLALSTESRNIPPHEAYEKIKHATQIMLEKVNPDYFFKKIDSTIRGNIAVEVLGMLEVLGWDAAIVVPAFPSEGRVTVGGYHLLKGVPVERTEMARDPYSPIFESHVPTLLKKEVGEEWENLIASIDLKDVMQGAGPILKKLNGFIADGKKLIVADAVSTTDIEQILLAMNKSDYKILPVGTAAAARCLSDMWFSQVNPDGEYTFLPALPKLVISGSATEITASQIRALEQSDDFDENTLFVKPDLETIVNGVSDELVERIVGNLVQSNIVIVHTSNLVSKFDGFSDTSFDAELTKDKLANMITDFLAELTKRVVEQKPVLLVLLGGETSYKCCRAIGASHLELKDEVSPAIALSLAPNNRWIVTKSGNLGNTNTLIDILKYLESHE